MANNEASNEWKKELISCLAPAKGSDLEIPKALLIKDKFIPERVYRYRKINEFLFDELRNSYVWLTNPNKYNDPFDSAHYIDFAKISKNVMKGNLDGILKLCNLKDLLSEDEKNNVDNSEDAMASLFDIIWKKNGEKDENLPPKSEVKKVIEEIISKQHEELLEKSSVYNQEQLLTCSFSERYDSTLMWSHYADEHKGVCIEYSTEWENVPKNPLKLLLYPMIYQEELLDLTYIQEEFVKSKDLNNMTALLCAIHKSKEWEYEREWRIVHLMGANNHGQQFYMPKPSRVILGVRIGQQEKERIINECEKLDIECVSINKSRKKYELMIGGTKGIKHGRK